MGITGNQASMKLSAVKTTPHFNIADGAALLIPTGRMIVAMQGDDANAPSVFFQMEHPDNGWTEFERYEDGNNLAGFNGTWVFIPFGFMSDGGNIRLYNNGGAPATNFAYSYLEYE